MKPLLENIIRQIVTKILQDDNFNPKSPNLDERVIFETNDFKYLKSLLTEESESYKNYDDEDDYYEKVLSQIFLMVSAACIPFAVMLFNKFQNQYEGMNLKVETEGTTYIHLQNILKNVVTSKYNEAIKGVCENTNEPQLPFENKESENENIESVIEIGTEINKIGTLTKNTFPRV
jgi:hypothetical protein